MRFFRPGGILLLNIFFSFVCAVDVPDEFDLREKYPQCTSLRKPLNQGGCGSCWAFSTTSVSSDFLCIKGYTNQWMAPEHSIQCDSQNSGCNGGYISKAFEFHINSGLVGQSCKMYLGTNARRCSTECDDGTTITASLSYKMGNLIRVHGSSNDDTKRKIKEAIYTNGSVAASYKVFSHFQDYYNDASNSKKVYTHPGAAAAGEFLTYHAIKIIGWGKGGTLSTGGTATDWWLIQNSWGTSWADGGYFRMNADVNAGTSEGLEGELDILGDVYQPYVDQYIDPCAKYYQCDECSKHGPKASSRRNTLNTSVSAYTSPSPSPSVSPSTTTTSSAPSFLSSVFAKVRGFFSRSSSSSLPPPPPPPPSPPTPLRSNEDELVCGYCLSTDMCISVDDNGAPVSGSCDEMVGSTASSSSRRNSPSSSQKRQRKNAEESEETEKKEKARVCPLDDCVQYTTDPLECVQHDGCQFCPQTKKCRKGSNGQQNTGVCVDPVTSVAQLAQNYSCLLYNTADCMKSADCVMCKPKDAGDSEYKCYPRLVGESEPTAKIGVLDDDYECKAGSASSGTLSPSYASTDICKHRSCEVCGAAGANDPCVWCYTTQSCIPKEKKDTCSISSLSLSEDAPSAYGRASYPSNALTRCSPCMNFSSCADCANSPQCGWYEQASFCFPGILGENKMRSILPEAFKDDTFITNKLRCPAIVVDDAEDESSRSSSALLLSLSLTAVGAALFTALLR